MLQPSPQFQESLESSLLAWMASSLRRRLLSAFLRIALDTGECRAPASGMQDLDNGYRAVRRYTKSRERPVRLVAHFRYPPIRCLQPRGQQSVGFGFRREPESVLKMTKASVDCFHGSIHLRELAGSAVPADRSAARSNSATRASMSSISIAFGAMVEDAIGGPDNESGEADTAPAPRRRGRRTLCYCFRSHPARCAAGVERRRRTGWH